MTDRLVLLDDPAWDGRPIPGERAVSLLAALVTQRAGVRDPTLIEQIWPDDPPTNPTKALQVLVSRVRSQTAAGVVVRYDGGYRLGLTGDEVDAWLLGRLVREAGAALVAGRPDEAVQVLEPVDARGAEPTGTGPLRDLRAVAERQRQRAGAVRGLALARLGRYTDALPWLEAAHADDPDSVELLEGLLRSVAGTTGTAAALTRYEAYRTDLSERLGVDPGPELQRLHRELLLADDPVRTGLRYDADELVGREDDLTRLRATMAGGRLTTILGPGGVGKTRIAHVLARESTLPRVHVVELVGVGSGDDVVAEVGAALGVRGSVTARRTLTPEQQADVRGRIAQELDGGPTLLVLDNCEHVLESVASLVAFLLVTSPDLVVLTTSRAPLRVSAERVVPLSQLAAQDAADLFRRRARAVRPGADLDPDTVAAIVDRLDGLPLAVELAAARIRALSAADVRRGLDDRFALLRGRDRSVPERHRTLAAVIEWSWDLLSAAEQQALAWLSVFHDGFDRDAAEAMVGHGATDHLEILVDHSLLVVSDSERGTRYRMLETIREFAGHRLAAVGEREAALAARDRWAVALVTEHGDLFSAADQIDGVDRLQAEETNLTDVLRRAVASSDSEVVARLLTTLGQLWIITGNHARVFAVADAAEAALLDWDAPADLRPVAAEAGCVLLIHFSWLPQRPADELREAVRSWGSPSTAWAQAAFVLFVQQPGDPADRLARAADRADDPVTAGMLLMWAALTAENVGDPRAAGEHAERGLRLPGLTPFVEASLHGELSQVQMVLGEHRAAAWHAERAWPTLLRLHADDDARSLRLATALAPLMEGDVEACEAVLDEVESHADGSQAGSRMVLQAARAEVALARGEVARGLALFDEGVETIRSAGAGTPFSTWFVLAAAIALAARVLHVEGDRDPRADELAAAIVRGAVHPGTGGFVVADLPLGGLLVVAVGAWTLRYAAPVHHDDGVRLLALADRFAYNRSLPSLAWGPLAALAERTSPGRLDALREEYAGRPGPSLLPDAAELLGRVTSSG